MFLRFENAAGGARGRLLPRLVTSKLSREATQFLSWFGAELCSQFDARCAAVVAAVANGMCEKGRDVTVRAAGGDLVVNYTDEKITLTGDAKLVYTGEALY